MITKDQKKQIISDLADKLKRHKVAVFTDYTGLSVNQAQDLRNQLREINSDYRVAKKTLIDLSLKESGLKDISIKDLNGQISVTFGYDDEVTAAKQLYDYSKTNDNLKILSAIVDGKYLTQQEVVSLAQLPSKQQLLGIFVGTVAAPMSGMLNVLQGNIRSLMYVLKNIKTEAEN